MALGVAIDTGGTFTDCVYLRDGKLVVLKVFSTPADPGRAVLNGLEQIVGEEQVSVRHGTTVGTNAMLERKGARVAFVTTKGFEDTIAIGRQARPKLYDWFQRAPECLVEDGLRFGVKERTTAEGKVIQEIDAQDLEELVKRIKASDVEAIAVSLLFAFANPENERRVATALARLGLPLSMSHRILPEFREYERASTVVANAYLAPKVGGYLTALADTIEIKYKCAGLDVMQSSGGIVSARVAAAEPVRTMLSGPAGGVIGAQKLASLAGFDRIIGFDMGGTSTDVCLVDSTQGGPHVSNESMLSGLPIAVPMLDIHTAGAGGGSIAYFDAGGMLRVGPESAGSVPGPICFGKGELPTVTDANLALGRLDTDRFLGGSVALDEERMRCYMDKAKARIGTVEEFAAGILQVIETSMAKAIRVVSVERGYDPRDFTLVAFGGGGPLHACSLAHALRVPRVFVPTLPGALSAVGILLADITREYSRTVMSAGDADVEPAFAALEAQAVEDFAAEGLVGTPSRSVDLRYRGQGYELNVPFGPEMLTHFHNLHGQRHGFSALHRPVEIVNVRVRMLSVASRFAPSPEPLQNGDGAKALLRTKPVYFDGRFQTTRVYDRELLRPGDTFAGPAIVSEYSTATVLPPGDVLRVDGLRNLVIEVH